MQLSQRTACCLRCVYKVTTLKDVVDEADKTTDDATVASDSKYHKNTALDGTDGETVETHQDEYLYVVLISSNLGVYRHLYPSRSA